MKKIIIIGAGFAGLTAASKLSRAEVNARITIFDRKKQFNFLPLLPDCIGRKIDPQFLAVDLDKIFGSGKVEFIPQEVTGLDLTAHQVIAGLARYSYDYLLVASGTEPNFYTNAQARQHSFTLNSVADAEKINCYLKENNPGQVVICGGGYTGIEVATNLARRFKNSDSIVKITLVERLPEILGALPAWMREYTVKNLDRLGIEVLAGTTIEKIEPDKIQIAQGREFERAMLIWVAGVKTADFIQGLEIAKNPQGRVTVNDYLGAGENCFWAGDAAWFVERGSGLRMAVQFALTQGALAAQNILRSIKGLPLKKYRPRDLGYIIPMANNFSCGRVLGLNVSGPAATFLHFMMCIYRSLSWRNKAGILRGLMRG